jgi:hypothetical protein
VDGSDALATTVRARNLQESRGEGVEEVHQESGDSDRLPTPDEPK